MSNSLKKQKGVATLLVAVVLLISITLVVIFTARVVLIETKVEANTYRTMQAFEAANYGLDYGINYFDNGGFDQLDETVSPSIAGSDDQVDNIYLLDEYQNVDNELRLTVNDNSQVTFAKVDFDIDAIRCGGTTSWKNGLISATGFSDDRVAERTMSQCVAPLSVLSDEGPDMPLISRTQVAMTGNANIINRYTNTNVWSGEEVTIGNSSSMSTYIREQGVENLTREQLLDTEPDNNSALISNNNLGNGADIIDNDPSLAKLNPEDFFSNFFGSSDYDTIENLADNVGQSYTNIDDAEGKSGLIWAEGDQKLTSNGDIGSIDEPAIVVINGNLETSGTPTIYGLLYVVGGFDVGGTVSVVGSSIVEGKGVSGNPVTGNGTLNLVYWQNFLNDGEDPVTGLTAVIDGSWRDW